MSELAQENAWPDWPVALVVGAAAMVFYALTACPTVYLGDSGELTNVIATLGVAHPTGYPLYTLLGKLFVTLVPFGRMAWRANLFSAVCAAGAVGVAYLVLRRMSVGRAAAAGGALLIGFSLSFWGEATIARVYALQALLTFAALLCLLGFMQEPRRTGFLWGTWVLIGLGLTNHVIVIVLAPAAAIVTLYYGPRGRRLKQWALTPLAILPALLLYLYVPIRAAMDPAINWLGKPTLESLAVFFARQRYWGRTYAVNADRQAQVVGHYLAAIPRELTWIGVALLLVGLVVMIRRKQYAVLGILLSLFVLNAAAMMAHGSVHDIFRYHRYMITGWSALGLAAGVGLGWVCGLVSGRAEGLAGRVCAGTAGVVALAAVGFVCLAHYHPSDKSRLYFGEDINRSILEDLPRDAVLLARGDDHTGPLTYLHVVEGVRPDIALVPIAQQKVPAWPDATQHDFYITQKDQNVPYKDKLQRAEGLVYHLVPRKDTPKPTLRWRDYAIRGLDDPELYLEDHAQELVSEFYFLKGQNLKSSDRAAAREAFIRSARVAPGHASTHVNTATALLETGWTEDAVRYYVLGLRLDPDMHDEIVQAVKKTRPKDAVRILAEVAAAAHARTALTATSETNGP